MYETPSNTYRKTWKSALNYIFGFFLHRFPLHFSLFICYIYNMTITQTVDIPADRRLVIDVPREVTTDKAYIIIQFPVPIEAQPKATSTKIGMTRNELDEFLEKSNTPISDSLLGILKTDMTIDEIRMARLAKHL